MKPKFDATKFSIIDMVTDASNGQTSHTKFWSNIASATATIIILTLSFQGKITLELFQWYLGLVGFQQLASKALSLKLGVSTTTSQDSPL